MKFSLTAGFAVLLALLATNGYITYRAVTTLHQNQHRIAELQASRIELGDLLTSYVNAETGQRGYLLTGDEKYLVPYYSALKALGQSETKLKGILAPTKELTEYFSGMQDAGRKKLIELDRIIQLRKERGFAAAQEALGADGGEADMDRIRELASRIDKGQEATMRLLLSEAKSRKQHAVVMSSGASVVLAFALCLIFVITQRNMNERTDLLAKELKAKDALQKALAAERAAHSDAEHANKLKDEFLAVVSHELRTPLNAIVGWTSLLRDGYDEEELKEGLTAIEKNTHAQARLVDDLLDISRIISGKLHLQITEVDLSKIIDVVADGLRQAASARGVTVTIKPCNESPELLGDADRLQQIAWNLLSNAIKFTPRGGIVTVSLSHMDSDVVMEVSDTGQGIKPEFLPHIFDRFSQQDASTTRGHAGLGLGLAITRHLAEMHGGKISAFSDGEDKGSTFQLQIPIIAVRELKRQLNTREASLTETAGEIEQKALTHIKDMRILAVDDQADTLTVVSRVLTKAGASVRTANSAADAREILASWTPDLIVSDIGMPEVDGYSFIREIRNSRDTALRKIPAIALTAFARETDRQLAISAGFNDHLAKPVYARALIEKAAEFAVQS